MQEQQRKEVEERERQEKERKEAEERERQERESKEAEERERKEKLEIVKNHINENNDFVKVLASQNWKSKIIFNALSNKSCFLIDRFLALFIPMIVWTFANKRIPFFINFFNKKLEKILVFFII